MGFYSVEPVFATLDVILAMGTKNSTNQFAAPYEMQPLFAI
jgi:hypothetical protein